MRIFISLQKPRSAYLEEPEWDVWRPMAEEAVFPKYKDRINFAALSLDALGLPHYGPCSLVCKPENIAHRATVFEQNCVVFMWAFNLKDAAHLPSGYRALWEARGKIAVAKLASKIQTSTTPDQFAELLLTPGASGEHDEFIEVHIYGPLSIHSFAKVTLRKTSLPSKAARGALVSKLAKFGIPLEII